jgi:hypothetical protein
MGQDDAGMETEDTSLLHAPPITTGVTAIQLLQGGGDFEEDSEEDIDLG